MESSLPGGLALRTATADDVPGAARLLADRGDPGDATDLELIVGTDGLDGVAVVTAGDRVISTLTLLDEVVSVGEVAVPAGQVELVATDPDYEGRGIVRALMGWAHQRSRARGHLLQVIVGIPYFYRQFGYEYAIPMPQWRPLLAATDHVSEVTVRQATATDIPAMHALQDGVQRAADIRMGHSRSCWEWLARRDGTQLWVAERQGEVVAVARTLPPDQGAVLAELAALDDQAASSLVAHAAARSSGQLTVQQRPGIPAALASSLGPATGKPDWYYARVGHLAPLLVQLAPVLQARLDATGLLDREHEILLSSWRAHLRFAVGPAGVRILEEAGAEQAPVSKGGSGIPPDAIASLVLGPYGALELEERLPDCHLGRQREVMAALFPPCTADLLTFYLPT